MGRLSLGHAFAILALASGNRTTYSGYLVDLYCYGLVRAGGRGLDGIDVIREPGKHTLHCLRDPPQCYEGFFMLAVNRGGSTPDYQAKFLMDEAGNQAALSLLRTYPRGHARDNVAGQFLVTVSGMHHGDGTLRDATVVECVGAGCDGNCTGNCIDVDLQLSLSVGKFLFVHVLFMVLSWSCLLPAGVLWARNLRLNKRLACGSPIWFQGHRILQSVGWLFQLVGFAAIILHKSQGGGGSATNITSPHEVIGLIVVIFGSLQPFNAQLRFLPGVGHASPDGTRTTLRRLWEYLHKGCGYFAVTLGCVNVVLGLLKADNAGFDPVFVRSAAGAAGFLLVSLFLAVVVIEAVPAILARARRFAVKVSHDPE